MDQVGPKRLNWRVIRPPGYKHSIRDRVVLPFKWPPRVQMASSRPWCFPLQRYRWACCMAIVGLYFDFHGHFVQALFLVYGQCSQVLEEVMELTDFPFPSPYNRHVYHRLWPLYPSFSPTSAIIGIILCVYHLVICTGEFICYVQIVVHNEGRIGRIPGDKSGRSAAFCDICAGRSCTNGFWVSVVWSFTFTDT